MSRGLGVTQRYVLDQLMETRREENAGRRGEPRHFHIHLAYDLAVERREDGLPSESEVETIRRAIRTLHKRGLVEAGHEVMEREGLTSDRRASVRSELWARLPLDDEEATALSAYKAARQAELDKRIAAIFGRPSDDDPGV